MCHAPEEAPAYIARPLLCLNKQSISMYLDLLLVLQGIVLLARKTTATGGMASAGLRGATRPV